MMEPANLLTRAEIIQIMDDLKNKYPLKFYQPWEFADAIIKANDEKRSKRKTNSLVEYVKSMV